jgi:multidrug/hemolysin transport system ATP-binding protein
MEDIIIVENLVKKYDDFVAVNNISFTVRQGQFFAFLGPNGAGKSTTINILCSLLKKTSGSIKVCSHEVDFEDEFIRQKIGVVFQENVLDDLLTVKENLLTRGALYFKDSKKLQEKYSFVIDFLKLSEIENKHFKNLSGGQKRKVEVARALISDPQILVLDEPTTGLDPETRKTVWELLIKLKKEFGITIFLTTHYMEEAAAADYVVVINKGNIVAKGSPNDLKTAYAQDVLVLYANNASAVKKYLTNNNFTFETNKKEFTVLLNNTKESINIINALNEQIDALEILKGTLDNAFINIIRG